MKLKPVVKRAARPVAQAFTRAVTRAVGPRLAALEDAHGRTWSDVQALKAYPHGVIEARIAALEKAHADTWSEVQTLTAYVPTVLGAASDQHAVTRATVRTERQLLQQTDHQNRRLDEIERRVEFIRRELLFELRYGGGSRGVAAFDGNPGSGVEVAREPKVLNAAKLESFGTDIRLNLGAGHIPVEGYLNVDARELDGIDIIADIRALPFEPGEVSVIYCAHLLEHFPVEEVRRSLLPYWFSVLRPGGRLIVVVPDAEAMIGDYEKGEMSFADLREVTFGGQEYDGDFHFNMYSKESLTALLAAAGFADAAITDSARRNGLCYEMQAEARRPDVAAPAP